MCVFVCVVGVYVFVYTIALAECAPCMCLHYWAKVALTLTFLMQLAYRCTDEQEFAVVSRGLEH